MGKTYAKYNWFDTGFPLVYDKATLESLVPMFPLVFYDDFLGPDVVIPATGSVEPGCKWSKKIVGTGPTVAKTADGLNGLVACSLTSGSEKQDAALHMNDELMFSIAQGAIFEARLTLTTLPTLLGIASFGLWGAWADGGSAYRVGFEIPASGIITCESDDASTDIPAASTVTLVAGEYHIFRINCTNQADIKFYIDGARVCSSTTFANVASAANAKMQPHIGLYKASGAGLGVISTDYVRIFQDRS
ncbi:hypothetical protein ES705_33633 [subsurface metagenome]